jgi:two-component system sensor histidine kinase PrrB
MKLLRSIGGRTALAGAAAATLAFAVAGAGVLIAADSAERRALDRDLRASVERVVRQADQRGGRPAGPPPSGRPGYGRGAGTARDDEPPAGPANGPESGHAPPLDPGIDRFARIIGPSGTVVQADGATVPAGFPLTTADGRLRTRDVGGQRWRTESLRLGPTGATLQVAARLAPLESRQSRLRTIVALALVVALAGGAALALGLSRVALAPLARLRAGAARVRGTDDLSARIEPGGGVTETDELAGEINAMLARLERASTEREQALAGARRFAADAGHELRTPLTSLTASIATLGRSDPAATAAALKRAEGDLARLTGLVGQLQALARGDAGLSAAAEQIDLGELADAAIDGARARHPDLSFTLEAPTEGPFVRGDADGLRGIVDNLLENAALHGRRDGSVAVQVSADATLIVDDDGPGIPAAEREAVLERFARGSAARGPGTGLGLAIVAAQAARHAGAVSLGDSPAGGLRVTVALGPSAA